MSPRAAPPPNARDVAVAGLIASPSGLERDRFAAALDRLVPEAPLLLLAVSGGPDSMAMLHLAAAAWPGRVAAATVDHRLRADAAEEARMVERYCAAIGVPHATLIPATPIAGSSLQARAREARYALLAAEARRIGAAAIVTAHHADDAAETFLMRAARGSGLAGLAGVRELTVIEGVTVARPLLDWRCAELRALAEREELPFVDDPANTDQRHDRTRYRRLLAANPWLDPMALAQAAAAIAEADAEIRALADAAWRKGARSEGARVEILIEDVPRELRRRLARRAIGAVRAAAGIVAPAWSEAANIEPLLDALAAGRRATQAGVIATPRGDRWHFCEAPHRRT